jgi:hypothetical protein
VPDWFHAPRTLASWAWWIAGTLACVALGDVGAAQSGHPIPNWLAAVVELVLLSLLEIWAIVTGPRE